MRALILGAGRGSRLNALTEGQPKPFAPIGGRRILDWLLEALVDAGIDDIVFIGGYRIGLVRSEYPQLTFVENERWQQTNILASLLCAVDYMDDGFVCTYADILYRSTIVQRALEHPAGSVLCVDTGWRTRYRDRSQHPEDDAEKVIAKGDRVLRVSRKVNSSQAAGEYIGVARFDADSAKRVRECYHRARHHQNGRLWRDDTLFEKAYLIHLFEEMLEVGEDFHMVTTDGEYMEVDTEEDFALANEQWPRRYESP
ncbi:MAG: phosphocholine cytidylyltransferase family protein [Candidatus Latescibacterota bacterium]|nr:phosphocholine cytidylyltransferase family protein [Candidatus Latescibacterota bacterium]